MDQKQPHYSFVPLGLCSSKLSVPFRESLVDHWINNWLIDFASFVDALNLTKFIYIKLTQEHKSTHYLYLVQLRSKRNGFVCHQERAYTHYIA